MRKLCHGIDDIAPVSFAVIPSGNASRDRSSDRDNVAGLTPPDSAASFHSGIFPRHGYTPVASPPVHTKLHRTHEDMLTINFSVTSNAEAALIATPFSTAQRLARIHSGPVTGYAKVERSDLLIGWAYNDVVDSFLHFFPGLTEKFYEQAVFWAAMPFSAFEKRPLLLSNYNDRNAPRRSFQGDNTKQPGL